MSLSLNHITLLGVIKDTPFLGYTPAGTPILSFDLLFPNPFNPEATETDDQNQITVILSGHPAQHWGPTLRAHSQVLLEGHLHQQHDSHTDTHRPSTHAVIARSLTLLPPESGPTAPPHRERDFQAAHKIRYPLPTMTPPPITTTPRRRHPQSR